MFPWFAGFIRNFISGSYEVEARVEDSFKKKLLRSRLKWAGHVERMGDDNIDSKRSDVEGKGGEEDRECDGRTALRDLERVGGEWRTTAKYRNWRLLKKVRNVKTKKRRQ